MEAESKTAELLENTKTAMKAMSGTNAILDADTMTKLEALFALVADAVCDHELMECDGLLQVMTEGIRFMPADSHWRLLSALMQKTCDLAGQKVVDPTSADLSAEALGARQHLIAEVKTKTQGMKGKVCGDNAALGKLVAVAICVHDTCEADFKKVLLTMLEKAREHLEEQKVQLAAVAYGSTKTPQVAWSKSLGQKCPISEIISTAEEHGLLAIDEDSLKTVRDQFYLALEAWKDWCGRAGQVVDDTLLQNYDKLGDRALVTLTEVSLVRMAVNPLGKECMRKGIQKEGLRIRKAGMKEASVWPTSLYKWAFSQLTCR